MEDHEDINLRMAGGIMKAAEIAVGAIGDEGSIDETDGRALPVYKMGENSIGKYSIGAGSDRRYFSGEAGGSGKLTAGCGAGRAYTIGDISTVPIAYFIGISDEGSIGIGTEVKPICYIIADEGTV